MHTAQHGPAAPIALLFLLFLLVTAACSGEPAATYAFSQLDVPEASSTVASGINDAGTIVGWYTRGDTVRGFVHRDGRFTTVEYPGAAATRLHGIGPGRDVVGSYRKAGEQPVDFHGFLLTASGEFVPIDAPGHRNTIAQRILPDGTVLGCQHGDDFTESMRGIAVKNAEISVLDTTATMTNGGTPDGRKMVGLVMDTHRAFLLDDGRFTTFAAPGAVETEAWDMNPDGTIVGLFMTTDSTSHGFALARGRFTTLDFPGATSTIAFGLNPRGDIVGAFEDGDGRQHGYLAQRR